MYLVLLTTMLLLMIVEGALVNISGSLEIRDSTHICVKLQKKKLHKFEHFEHKKNTRGSKTVYIPIHTNYDYRGRLLIQNT